VWCGGFAPTPHTYFSKAGLSEQLQNYDKSMVVKPFCAFQSSNKLYNYCVHPFLSGGIHGAYREEARPIGLGYV
jgi:hypothetical protein